MSFSRGPLHDEPLRAPCAKTCCARTPSKKFCVPRLRCVPMYMAPEAGKEDTVQRWNRDDGQHRTSPVDFMVVLIATRSGARRGPHGSGAPLQVTVVPDLGSGASKHQRSVFVHPAPSVTMANMANSHLYCNLITRGQHVFPHGVHTVSLWSSYPLWKDNVFHII